MNNESNVIKFDKRRRKKKHKRRQINQNKMAVIVFCFIVVISIYGVHKCTVDGNGFQGMLYEINQEEKIYNDIYSQLTAFKTRISFNTSNYNIMSEMVSKQYRKVLSDHPELFWLSGGAEASGVTSAAGTLLFYEVDTICDMDDAKVKATQLESVVQNIIELTNSHCTSDYDKAKYVHDLLVLNCEYDMDTYYSYLDNPTSDSGLGYTAYGCLVDHKAVCAGYSKAYQLIMNKLGIECGFVYGIGINDDGQGPHAWNYICLDGKYYMVDVTWDDPLGNSGDVVYDTYFCISPQQMAVDHIRDLECIVPYE